jgi:ATP-binding cassette subfamily A (ABC1) protein 3
VNGAGKTTTFKMLTGDEIPSSGRAFVNGYNLANEQFKANDHIGYCPQFDGLLEFLTVREHLELFSGIRCIPYLMRKRVINFKLQELDLERF